MNYLFIEKPLGANCTTLLRRILYGKINDFNNTEILRFKVCIHLFNTFNAQKKIMYFLREWKHSFYCFQGSVEFRTYQLEEILCTFNMEEKSQFPEHYRNLIKMANKYC